MARIEVGYHHGGFPCRRIRGPDRKHRLAANQRTVSRRGAGFFARERQSSMKHGAVHGYAYDHRGWVPGAIDHLGKIQVRGFSCRQVDRV